MFWHKKQKPLLDEAPPKGGGVYMTLDEWLIQDRRRRCKFCSTVIKRYKGQWVSEYCYSCEADRCSTLLKNYQLLKEEHENLSKNYDVLLAKSKARVR